MRTRLECMARREAKEACEERKNGDNVRVAYCDGAVEAYDAAKELSPICGGEAEVVAFYIKGVANRLNYFVRCK